MKTCDVRYYRTARTIPTTLGHTDVAHEDCCSNPAVWTGQIPRPGLVMSLCAEHYEEAYTTISNRDLRRLLAIEAAAEHIVDSGLAVRLSSEFLVEGLAFTELQEAVRMYDES